MRTLCLVLFAVAASCKPAEAPGAPSENPMPNPSPPPAAPKSEPPRIVVQHILIAFSGTGTRATRTREAAQKLAEQTFERARKGEDFARLVKELSDDSGEGIYGIANRGLEPRGPGEYPRTGMVAAFGDVGFQLEVGEVGLAFFDPQKSPYGWHIIKRLK